MYFFLCRMKNKKKTVKLASINIRIVQCRVDYDNIIYVRGSEKCTFSYVERRTEKKVSC
jgi:hypothetical protein